jgi:hypothetical protein
MESGPPGNSASAEVATMTPGTTAAAGSTAQTVRELLELIAALDRRVPHVERVGEIAIVRAASALKLEALKRIEELEQNQPPSSSAL